MRFKIKHLLVVTLLTAVGLAVFFHRTPPRYSCPDVESAIQNTRPGWETIEVLGDEEGPFRVCGAFYFGMISPRNKPFVTYVVDGDVEKFTLPRKFEGHYAKASFFKNRKGNTLCVLYVRTGE